MTLEKIIEIVMDELGLDPENLNAETRLDKIFHDSLEFINFTMRLDVTEDTLAQAETLGDLANAVHPN